MRSDDWIRFPPAFAFPARALDSEGMEFVFGGPNPAKEGAPASPCETQVRPENGVFSKQRLAPLYRVLIHNDDVTPMDFVVMVLLQVFKKDTGEACRIMLEAHTADTALVAVLPLEQAELRVDQAHSLARTAKFPLTLSYEPE